MPDFSHEQHYGLFDGNVICGVDEVGRGPLAGPVIAAAVILPPTLPPTLTHTIRDSKKMTVLQRERMFDLLMTHGKIALGESSVEEIDRLNILQASMLAMQRAVDGLAISIDMALIDGNRCPTLACPATAIIKGDNASLSIAAAAIMAKVTRDRLMIKLAQRHGGYGWERNMGYGTAEHLMGLRRFGVTPWHRTSFAPVRAAMERSAKASDKPHT